jgi:uroporphyrin-III C-methyltransferase/precorrin-2 dehydrogenase/sirohydrochlorin ferrochelatase
VSFVTGHDDEGGSEPDWRALARPKTTAVIYMGLARLSRIAARLIEHGAPPERPAAVISRGTTPEQQVTVAPLAHVAAAAQSRGLESPALLIVGEVAALHATLAWFGGAAAAPVSESA